jgi:hypothetical protein
MGRILVVLGVCALVLTTGCPPSTVTCDFNDAGVCGGNCPSGQVCSSVGKTGCACQPEAGSPFCGFNDAHACAGPCPEGQVCSQKGATVCTCVAAGAVQP